ncbi:RNA polymerase sigma factor [Kineococcus sp. SYSU DK005]|uniref:RNA polymerase sigma factor n=1 Tax=Kineococcus sp. SYSU DK005 TaxID=3383126 RepID=UPI003D7DE6B3
MRVVQERAEAQPARERFTALYEQHYAAVLAYVRRRGGEQHARDVTAEVFTTAWRRLEQVREPALPWLLRTAAFTLANAERGQRRSQRLAARLSIVDPPGTGADPAEDVSARHRVLQVLAQLGERDRELVLLTSWEGLTPTEAAQVVGCSAPTARVRLHRARARLRTLLADVDEADLPGQPARPDRPGRAGGLAEPPRAATDPQDPGDMEDPVDPVDPVRSARRAGAAGPARTAPPNPPRNPARTAPTNPARTAGVKRTMPEESR